MLWKEFFLRLLTLISFDSFIAFILYIFWKYINFKYFSSLDIITLKEENQYLKNENQKLNGTSTKFWDREDFTK